MCRRSVKQFMAAFSIGIVAACVVPVQAQETEAKGQSAETVTVPVKTMQQLQQHLTDLEVEVQQLKSQMNDMQSTISTSKGAAGQPVIRPTARLIASHKVLRRHRQMLRCRRMIAVCWTT
jgi:uncharacterized protein YlxW (UPF0749 family)